MPGKTEKANLHATHKCSFCGRSNIDTGVNTIVAGPGVSICDRYVLICVDTIFKKDRGVADESGN